jgi:cytochrome P450
MSDVGIALERNIIYKNSGFSIEDRAHLELSNFWGQNANTQPLLFWFVTYIYSTPGLLDELRKEVAPFVKLSGSEVPDIASIDIPALGRDCPLFKSTLFETYRLASEPTSIRRVARPMTVPDNDLNHKLPAGSYVSVALSLMQRDPAIFPAPDQFVPDRFLEFDGETGKKIPRYGRLRPWGVGPGSCKGRTFAEKEIMTIAAAMIIVWDVEAIGGTWKLPAMIPGTGAKKPVKDIRVVLKRRVSQ